MAAAEEWGLSDAALFGVPDIPTEQRELAHDVLVPPPDMLNLRYATLAVGDQARENQARAGPDVERPDVRSMELRRTGEARLLAVLQPNLARPS
jgi:hypothetical protein